ncbi:MAG: hypothetical protein A3J37_05105 [Alphaproteobacteria bacterium RIFCSPHIGHO2_12_FULL_45_9]|nr:MAG: hypothetical protein A3B66_04310 [Alphaproteobacteria bacterium RIFCSPHIGHO2_02_FULL_46_13]OFW99393.1 MAG: hypothetical protein A3J37_05105 [Alphaproteobacteria bacterium RIFCSPHIGHO2_12_FULL_45_9]
MQNFSDTVPAKRKKKLFTVGLNLHDWNSQFAGKTFDERAQSIELFSRHLAPRGSISLNGTPKEKKEARNFLLSRIDEDMALYHLQPEVSCSASSPVHFLAAFSRLQTLPPSIIFQKLIDEIELKMSGLDANSLSGIPGYFSGLGVCPSDDFINTWWDHAKYLAKDWNLKDSYRIIYQLAILDCIAVQDGREPTPCADIIRPVMRIFSNGADDLFPQEVDSQIYYAAKWFGYDFIEGRIIQSTTERISEAEKFVGKGLADKGFTIYDDHVLQGTQHRFDLVIAFNRNSVGLEIDGPFHFVFDAENQLMRYNGSTRLHTVLMEKMMGDHFRILRIPYPQLERRSAIDNIEQTLRHLNGHPKGAAYIMRGAKSVMPTNQGECWSLPSP